MIKTTTIKKGTHSPLKLPKFIFSGNGTMLFYDIEFTESCRYDLGTEDQLDINKLFGIGYFPHHHKNSIRFGWRYDTTIQKMEILTYWYRNGVRNYEHICHVEIGVPYVYSIHCFENRQELSIYGKNDNSRFFQKHTTYVPSKEIGYILRPYFGGNRKAPHNMTIKIY